MQNIRGFLKARLLELNCGQSHSQGMAARVSSETLQWLKASNRKCCLQFTPFLDTDFSL